MKVQQVYQHLESIAPLMLQNSYDNSGLICGSLENEVKGIMISLDCTEEIIDEALANDCNVVLAHHPIWFGPMKSLTGANYVERTIIKAIKNDINIMAWHTNLDNVLENGVNSIVAEKLGLSNVEVLLPMVTEEDSRITGSGLIGELPAAMERLEFFEYLKNRMELNQLKYTKNGPKSCRRVAVCGGAGSFLIDTAIKKQADIFITGDLKYHEFFDGENFCTLVDIGHYESEKYTIDLLHSILTKKFSTFAILKTNTITNPIDYYH